MRTEAVPFARPVEQSGFTRDFEHLVAWLATRMDKAAIERAGRIAWWTHAKSGLEVGLEGLLGGRDG